MGGGGISGPPTHRFNQRAMVFLYHPTSLSLSLQTISVSRGKKLFNQRHLSLAPCPVAPLSGEDNTEG